MLNSLKEILRSLDAFVGEYPIYVYLADKMGKVVWMNRYIKTKLRKGDTLSLINDAEVFGDLKKLLEDESFKTGNAQKSIIKSKFDGNEQEVYLDFLSLPVQDKGGEIEGILRIGFDVTEAQIGQAEMREKEKLFTSIIDSSVDAIIFLDNEDRIVSWNQGAESIFGYTKDEIVGKSILQIIPKELIEVGELYFMRQELEKKEFIKEYETQRLTKDGKSIFVDVTRTMIYDEKGNPVGSSAIIKDNTNKKKLEFGLLRTIVELSKINELNEILYTTYDQNEIYQLILIAITAGEGLRFNRAFLLLIDGEERCLRGHLAIGPSNEEEAAQIWNSVKDQHGPLREIIHRYKIDVWGRDHQVNEIVEQIRIPLNQTDHILVNSVNSRKTYQVKNGTIVDAKGAHPDFDVTHLVESLGYDSFVIVPLYTKQEPLGVIIADNRITRREISTEDIESLKLFAIQASSAIENTRLYKNLEARITDLQNMNQQLKENQDKLVKAERLAAIGEMSATVAHEIRNPLVSIGGFANLIEKKISEKTSVERYAKIITEQVHGLEFILSNLLNLANPPKPEKRSVDLNHIVHQVATVLRTSLDRRNIELKLDLTCIEGKVIGDAKLLHQAFLNLLKNAIEALESIENKGEISISTRCEEGYVELICSDNGPGMDPQVVNKIFDTFFTTKSSGTGLGLAIVKQIIETHKGEITVASAPNRGTTFNLKFPIYQNKQNNA